MHLKFLFDRWLRWYADRPPALLQIAAVAVSVVLVIGGVTGGVMIIRSSISFLSLERVSLSLLTRGLEQGSAANHAAVTPDPLQWADVEHVTIRGSAYAVTELSNYNALWKATAPVEIVSNGSVVAVSEVVVPPNSTRPVVSPPLSSVIAGNASFTIKEARWKWLGGAQRMLESTGGGNPFTLASADLGSSGDDTIVRLAIMNSANVSFRDAVFLLRWREGRRLAGLSQFTVASLPAGSTRAVTLGVSGRVAPYARFTLDPLFDGMDTGYHVIPQGRPEEFPDR